MSGKFMGVTFSQQKVKPSDDAIIRRAILFDGVLTGCEMSYSGSTLTMTAGHLIICGRQIVHPSTQNWAVVDATSGYARLLLTVDMTRTSTKDVFNQVIDTIEYSETVDGFSGLTQSDINEAGAKYQFVACVVSLGSGGITGIVSQAGNATVFAVPEDIGAVAKTGGTLTGSLTVEATPNGSQGYKIQKTVDNKLEELRLLITSSGLPIVSFYEGDALVNRMVLNREYTSFNRPVTVASGGTDATTAEQALLNLGGISMKKVWENASLTSDFAAQKVPLTLATGDAVYVESVRSTDDSTISGRTLVYVGGLSGYLMGTTDQLALTRRKVTASTSGVTFTAYSSANTTSGTSNEIPYRIYVIKGVSK